MGRAAPGAQRTAAIVAFVLVGIACITVIRYDIAVDRSVAGVTTISIRHKSSRSDAIHSEPVPSRLAPAAVAVAPLRTTAVKPEDLEGLCGHPATAVISQPISAGNCAPELNAAFKSTVKKVTQGRQTAGPDDVLQWLSDGADCPENLQFGWRQFDSLVPLVLGTKCEPWWRREAIVVMDTVLRELKKRNEKRGRRTIGVEWGGGSSSIWLSKRLDKLWVVESDDGFFQGMNASADQHRVWKTRMDACKVAAHREVAARAGRVMKVPECGNFTNVRFAEMPEPHSVDFISVDSTYCRENIISARVEKLLVPDGGILVVDNSDRAWYQDALKRLPSHWLRYDTPIPWPNDWKLPCVSDASHWNNHGGQSEACLNAKNVKRSGSETPADWPQLDKSRVDFWVRKDNLRTSIWITRSKECADKS